MCSGSDGLVKLWTIKNSECVKTFDEHEGKVWALTTNSTEEHVVTGADDSSIIIWKVQTLVNPSNAEATFVLSTRTQRLLKTI